MTLQTRLALDDQRGRNLHHLDLTDVGPSEVGKKTLHQKASGKFYTHEVIGRRLARHLLESIRSADHYSIVDPFCGDGRLVRWLMEELFRQHRPREMVIALWDVDGEAVKLARESIEPILRDAGVPAEFDLNVGDSFARARDSFGIFDCVITNPPWELLKPDRRELGAMLDGHKERYIEALRRFDARLAVDYPTAQPARRFAGWGTNLSRVGTEAAMRLVKDGGVCGVVSPSSLFADANSDNLRAWMFARSSLTHIDYFPAEARLFDGVDVPSIAFASRVEESRRVRPVVTTFSGDRTIVESRAVSFHRSLIRENGYVLPIAFGASGAEVLQNLFHLPRFVDLEGKEASALWAGREIDETRRERFMTNRSDAPFFLKGVNIKRFGMAKESLERVDVDLIRVPTSTSHPRLVWRDVARPSQKRRVHATLIPRGWVCGNSLGVAYFRDDDKRKLRALLALFASLPFEYQLRSMLSTGHVSLTSVRRVHLPELRGGVIDSLTTAAELVMKGLPGAEAELEVSAARAFGLDREAWETIIAAFPKLTSEETERLLGVWATRTVQPRRAHR